MKRTPAIFTDTSIAMERRLRALCRGNFRTPESHFKPSQMASEMALAARGFILLRGPADYSRSSLKHIAYLHDHMTCDAKPIIVLAFDDPNNADVSIKSIFVHDTLFGKLSDEY